MKNLTGLKFGRLLVIEATHERDKCRRVKYRCICECGNEIAVASSSLLNNHTKSCGCIKKTNHHNWLGYGEISGQYWKGVIASATKRNLIFTISIENAWGQFQKQSGKCAITGLELSFVRNYKSGNLDRQTASLDRIDSNQGYTNDNIQWTHKVINTIKGNLPDNELEAWSELICCPNSSQDCSGQLVTREKCKGHWNGFGEISGEYWNKVMRCAKVRNINFNITIDYAWNLFLQQDRRCALTKTPLLFVRNFHHDKVHQTASLDRTDSKTPYEEGNVQWVHKKINILKWCLSTDELLYWCDLIVKHKGKK